MNVLAFATLVITGFVACAEFGSYAFVHPVIRRLPQREHLQVEQGLLRRHCCVGRVCGLGQWSDDELSTVVRTSRLPVPA